MPIRLRQPASAGLLAALLLAASAEAQSAEPAVVEAIEVSMADGRAEVRIRAAEPYEDSLLSKLTELSGDDEALKKRACAPAELSAELRRPVREGHQRTGHSGGSRGERT